MISVHGYEIKSIYEAIGEAAFSLETYAVTVISGDEAGEKAVFSGGALICSSDEDGFIKKHEAEIGEDLSSGVSALDGRELFTELLGNEKHMVICGAGHLSMPLITIAKMIGMRVTVVDDRKEFAANAAERGADKVICKPFKEAFEEIEGDDDTFFVIVTRGHRYDKDCVGASLLKRHAYVGMIGSKRHAKFVREALLKEGISEALIDSIYTPIGLKIGAETPEEIAIAIAAEVIEVKNEKRRNFGFPKEIVKSKLEEDREPMILATIITREGSAPRGEGTKMLVKPDGSIIGTVGGGVAENDVIEHCRNLLAEGFTGTEVMRHDLTAFANEDGMVCGGMINVLLEAV